MIRTALLAAALGTFAAGTLPLAPAPAAAQNFRADIGDSLAGFLQQAGFGEFRIIERELARTVVEACQGDRKFRVSVNLLGQVKRKEPLGACDIGRVAQSRENRPRAGQLSAPRLNRRLTRAGFTDVEARPIANGRFVADACRDGRRMRMRFEPGGERIDQNVVGVCRDGRLAPGATPVQAPNPGGARNPLNPQQVRQALRGQGYSQIRFTDADLPRYVAEACNAAGKRLELVMNRFGEVRNQRDLGRCQQTAARPGLTRQQVTAKLGERGFDNVNVTKIDPPIQAQACRRSDRFEMTLNALGEIINQRLTGKCQRSIDKTALEKKLRDQGFSRLEVSERPNGFFANGCNGTQRLSLSFNPQGQESGRKVEGPCKSQTVAEVVNTLESRGARNLEVVLEGCFRDDRYRWRFNQLGDRLGRERVGPCN